MKSLLAPVSAYVRQLVDLVLKPQSVIKTILNVFTDKTKLNRNYYTYYVCMYISLLY